jgi:hypothetical protein
MPVLPMPRPVCRPPDARAAASPAEMYACRKCGRIWAPANDPRTCPCGQGTMQVSVSSAMRLNAARQQKLRERALRRRDARRRERTRMKKPGRAGLSRVPPQGIEP